MSSNLGLLPSVPTELSALARFLVENYIPKYNDYLDSCLFQSIPIDVQHRFVYDSRYGFGRVTIVGAWIERWACWCGHRAAFGTGSVVVSPDMFFISCTEDLSYMFRSAVSIAYHADLCKEDLSAQSLR